MEGLKPSTANSGNQTKNVAQPTTRSAPEIGTLQQAFAPEPVQKKRLESNIREANALANVNDLWKVVEGGVKNNTGKVAQWADIMHVNEYLARAVKREELTVRSATASTPASESAERKRSTALATVGTTRNIRPLVV